MELLETRLVLSPPGWPVLLGVLALTALALEFVALLGWVSLARSRPQAWTRAAVCLLLGPIVAVVGGLYVVAARAARQPTPHAEYVRGAAWASLIGALALLTMYAPPAGAVAAIGTCAVLWAFRAYRRTTSPIPLRRKAFLLALRISALLLLILWALGPTIHRVYLEEVPAAVLVGIDQSLSMAIPDMTREFTPAAAGEEDDAVSRIDAVGRAVRMHHDDLRALAERARVRTFGFAGGASQGNDLPDKASGWNERIGAADGPQTAIADSTYEALTRCAAEGREVAAVLLLTDGSNNTANRYTPDRLGLVLSDLGVRFYAAGVGRTSKDPAGAVRILDVRDLTAPEQADAFNKVPIRATVFAGHLAGREVEVTCRFGEEVVRSERVQVQGDSFAHAFSHGHVALQTGLHKVTVTAKILGDPPRYLTGARQASRLVQIRDRKLRILYVEGKFRYETKYVTRALAAAPRFELDRRIILRPFSGDDGAAPLADLGEDEDKWLRYHAVLLGSVGPEAFTPGQLEIIEKLVGEYGKGFAMLGGAAGLGNMAWRDTPVAGIMPVALAPPGGPLKEDLQVVPTNEGLNSPILQIAQENQGLNAAWSKLDELPGASRLGDVKPGATVLARTGPAREDPALLVRQEYGKGRVLAIAFDTTWRWVLSPKDTAEMQRRFWRQVALYLCAPRGNVWVEAERPEYDLRRLEAGRETIRITAGVEDSSGVPRTTAEPRVKLLRLGEKRPEAEALTEVALVVDEDKRQYLGELSAEAIKQLTAGQRYAVRITATIEGKELDAEYQFEVTRPAPDAQDTQADFDALRRMSLRTRGGFRRLDEFAALLREIRLAAQPRTQPKSETRNLADTLRWPALVAIITLLCLEWAWRKRRGLV